jgi:hypothetical protein
MGYGDYWFEKLQKKKSLTLECLSSSRVLWELVWMAYSRLCDVRSDVMDVHSKATKKKGKGGCN